MKIRNVFLTTTTTTAAKAAAATTTTTTITKLEAKQLKMCVNKCLGILSWV